jgi:mercuric ion transport protein
MRTSPARRFNSEGSVVADLDQPEEGRGRWWVFAVLPGIGTALLPKLTCPVCWPAYTALLSSFGINFVDYTPYLLPTVSMLLAITLGALAYRARRRQGYGPFGLGVLGAAAILFGKFASEIDVGVYAGAGLLIVASIWNLWPRRQPSIN